MRAHRDQALFSRIVHRDQDSTSTSTLMRIHRDQALFLSSPEGPSLNLHLNPHESPYRSSFLNISIGIKPAPAPGVRVIDYKSVVLSPGVRVIDSNGVFLSQGVRVIDSSYDFLSPGVRVIDPKGVYITPCSRDICKWCYSITRC